MTGCEGAPPPEPPVPVRAADLARSYRDDWRTAAAAYDNRPVRLALTAPVRRGSELHWHVGGPDFPAVVVCRMATALPGPLPARVWVVGTCAGRVPDGRVREFAGYDFHVLIVGCRVADPPTP